MNYFYEEKDWPRGFEYPDMYRSYIERASIENLYPWLFIDVNSVVGLSLLNVTKSKNVQLIPFSSNELGDGDVACFNINGEVEMLILDDSGRTYGYKNFNAWLSSAREDHEKWS